MSDNSIVEREIIFERECGIIRDMIKYKVLPSDIVYPVTFTYWNDADGENLAIEDSSSKVFFFDL